MNGRIWVKNIFFLLGKQSDIDVIYSHFNFSFLAVYKKQREEEMLAMKAKSDLERIRQEASLEDNKVRYVYSFLIFSFFYLFTRNIEKRKCKYWRRRLISSDLNKRLRWEVFKWKTSNSIEALAHYI